MALTPVNVPSPRKSLTSVTAGMGYDVTVLSASKFTDLIATTDTSEFAVSSSQILVRDEVRKFETFRAMSQLVDGDEILRNMLRSKTTRNEFEVAIPSVVALESVLTYVFGQSGNAEANSPRYSSQDVVRAVASAPVYKDVSVDTQLLIAACLNDMLDVFKMRQEAASASWVYAHSANLSPTMDDVINGLTEASVADKMKHLLVEFKKKVDVPSRRFNIFAFTQLLHVTLREFALALNGTSYNEVWMRDVFQLIGRHIMNDQAQIATYGAPRSNGAIEALLQNATIVRLAMEAYDKGYICTMPAHELRNTAEMIARNLSNLRNFKVVTNMSEVVQLSGYRRNSTGALISAVVNGVRKSQPDAFVYTVIPHDMMGTDFVDVVNKTKEFGALVPSIPKHTLDRLITDTVIVAEESAMIGLKTRFTSMILAKADITDALLHDAVATMCPIYFNKVDAGLRIMYFVVDTDKRLSALSPSNFDNMILNNASVALAAVAPLVDSIVTKPLFMSESLIDSGKFTGIWAHRKTTMLSNVTITIRDLLSADGTVPSFEVPLFGVKRALPNFTEISSTLGWSKVNELLNQLAESLNGAGSQKSQLQRIQWVTSVTTLLANWVNTDVALHSLVMKSITMFSQNAQSANHPEEYYATHSYYHGMIALQCATGVLNAMSALSDEPVELNEAFLGLMSTPETLLSFSGLVGSN